MLLSQKYAEPSRGFETTSQAYGWRPSYLRKRILISFILLFGAIIAALEILYKSSKDHSGIAASTENRHYLWTYGPTAIITVIIAFWSRVEFQTKQSAPWQALHDNPQPAEKSVLVDYVSTFLPKAVIKASRNKHFHVVSSVKCTFGLRLLMALSTSLFSLTEVPVQKGNIPIQLHDQFSVQKSALDTAGSQPYDILNGVIFKNLTYPIGTTEDLTFQEFSASGLPPSTVITAKVDGLTADLNCEDASIDESTLHYLWSNQTANVSNFFKYHISSPSCSITNAPMGFSDGQLGVFGSGNCDNINGTDGFRVVLALVDTHYKSRVLADPATDKLPDNTTWEKIDLGLKKSKSYICKPNFSLVRLEAKGNATELSSDVQLEMLGSNDANIPGMTAVDLAELVIDGNTTLSRGFREVEDLSPRNVSGSIDVEYVIGINLMGVQNTLDAYWQDDVFRDSAIAYYRAISAQLLHIGLKQKKRSMIVGSATMNENRVVMMESSLRSMEVCLALAILLAIGVLWKLPKSSLSTLDPNYLTGTAAITANSDEFRISLSGTGVASNKALQPHLIGKQYHLQSTPKGTSIAITENNNQKSQLNPSTHHEEEYQDNKEQPKLIWRILIFGLVLAEIGILEFLLRKSQNEDGIGDAFPNKRFMNRAIMHWLWTFLPALIMVATGLAFSCIDFNIRLFAPYAPLRRPEGASFARTMNVSFLDALGLTNFVRSIRLRHFAVLLTTLATTAALFLTIITGGLYSVIQVPVHTDVNFTRVGGFPDPRTIAGYLVNMDEQGQNAGILTSEYILQYDLSFPRWSYEEFALTEIAMDNVTGTSVNGSFVDIRVPALRLAPRCELQTAAEMDAHISLDGGYHRININQSRRGCPGSSNYYWKNFVLNTKEELKSEPFGYSSSSECYSDPEKSDSQSAQTPYNHYYATFFAWGTLKERSIEHIMGLSCLQYVEMVDVKTRFSLPTLEIDIETPPVPDESSARVLEDLYTPYPQFWVLNQNGRDSQLDGFFQILVSGKYAIPIDNLKSAEHDDAVIKAIKHQHKVIGAQQMSNYTRGTANDSIEHAPLLGNVTSLDRLRVFQDAVSTRVLQGLLALILILSILGSVLLNTDHVLPKNPCSIAAAASFLADSKLLDEFNHGSWDPKDKKIEKRFASLRFYLGWQENDSSDENRRGKRDFTIYYKSVETETASCTL